MSKFNKIFIYTFLICTSAPFFILSLVKLKIFGIATIITLLFVITVFYLISKIHPILLCGRFNLSKFNKNLFIFSLITIVMLYTTMGFESALTDKETLNKLLDTNDLSSSLSICILLISFVVFCISNLFKHTPDFVNEYDEYYRKCTIKSKIEIKRCNTGDNLLFDIELDTPIDNEKCFKFLTKQLELQEILKENQKVIINGTLEYLEIEQEDGSTQIYKSIDGEIINKDFILNHKIKMMKDTFKNKK